MGLTIYDIIENSASQALELQRSDGAMPSGHNGPYYDEETPVRNTSHWLITFAKAHELTGRTKFKEAVRKAASYLCSREARPMEKSFWHRKSSTKDTCNGLIGQAWTIEALATVPDIIEHKEAVRVAEEVFLLHPFHEGPALWERMNADGSYIGVDLTFNHQLWYAAAGALLSAQSGNDEVGRRVSRFLDNLHEHLRIRSSGLIRHVMVPKWSWKSLSKSVINRLRRFAFSERERHNLWMKEVGYHAFNLFAFGVLKGVFSEHKIWNNKKLINSVKYVLKSEYINNIYNTKYGFPYNPPGFEVPFAMRSFNFVNLNSKREKNLRRKLISHQISEYFNFEKKMMCKNTEDKATQSARLYEATRLKNIKLG